MRLVSGTTRTETRGSALWGGGSGSGGRGSEARGNALWGKGGRRIALLACLSLLVAGGAGFAGSTSAATSSVQPTLLAAAQANPGGTFSVIAQGTSSVGSKGVADTVKSVQAAYPANTRGVTRALGIVDGVAAQLSGAQVIALASSGQVGAITPDAPVSLTGYTNRQKWPDAAQVSAYWQKALKGLTAPTIAVVDSGVDATHPDLTGRVVAQQTLTTLSPNSPGDGRGHGTFVAGIAAGSDTGYAGAVPNENIVSLDVLADDGTGVESDVIAACDWILQNKAKYNIRVANFSLNAGAVSTFLNDPLDKAVERLWFNGVVVVTAAGNYAVNGQASGVLYAPANDPFVITVGASDTHGDTTPTNDFAAPWSAFGYTPDGFYKPELAAPGRSMNGPIPANSTMLAQHPERLVAPGYMWMSGTSFAAPVVSGAAAYVLAVHPGWTPDQVKGALMLRAVSPLGYTAPGGLGVGVVQADAAAFLADGTANPNRALDQYIKADPLTGAPLFDSVGWASTAHGTASWDSASWDSASWSTAFWNTASWDSASWDSASWDSASWDSSTSAVASWDSASWESLVWVH